MIDVDLNRLAVPLDWREVFGRDAPVEVEIGSGKGRFLLEAAAERRERDFLAVERAGPYHHLVCERAAKRGLTNVRLLRTSAEDLLFRLLRPASVTALYILFPDPWPKRRHHKRRLFSAAVAAQMAEVLLPAGRLLVKTDHADYGEVIDEVLAATSALGPLDPELAFAGLPITGFERKYLTAGRAIRAFACERREPAGA
jgi:tRNA (guanine-N7-)-methyltransferase